MGLSLIVNGMGNGLVAPIASKLASVYQLSTSYVSSPVVVSFLVYSLVNFPANHLTDTRGLRVSFLIGNAFYTMGLLLYVMVSKAYYYAILGSIFIAIGQPFIINCPAKVATFWFLHSNVLHTIYLENSGHQYYDSVAVFRSRDRVRAASIAGGVG